MRFGAEDKAHIVDCIVDGNATIRYCQLMFLDVSNVLNLRIHGSDRMHAIGSCICFGANLLVTHLQFSCMKSIW
jgi:hypothetical protein